MLADFGIKLIFIKLFYLFHIFYAISNFNSALQKKLKAAGS